MSVIRPDNLQYRGAFKLPSGPFANALTCPIAYNPVNHSLWAVRSADSEGAPQGGTEVTIPNPVSAPIAELPTADAPSLGGVAYDAKRNWLFVTQCGTDATLEFGPQPLVHVWQIC